MSSERRPSTENKTRRPTERRPKRQEKLSGAQVTFAAIVAIGLILAINFSTRLAASRPLNEYYEGVEDEIGLLQEEQATLIAERDFALSDAFVEQWARSDGKMVKPGEILVVPFALGGTPTPVVAASVFVEQQTSRPEPENWRLWWSLLFDSDPPKLGR